MSKKLCSFEGCARELASFGLCQTHYCQQRRGEPLRDTPRRLSRTGVYPDGLRQCSKCRQMQPVDLFKPSKTHSDGLSSSCKPCISIRNANSRYKQKYGIGLAEYEAMLGTQNGCCAICGEPPEGRNRLAVDHDHSCCPGEKSCGKCVRSLLCFKCNTAIGLMQDDPERLRKAALYVESFRASVEKAA